MPTFKGGEVGRERTHLSMGIRGLIVYVIRLSMFLVSICIEIYETCPSVYAFWPTDYCVRLCALLYVRI